MPKFTEIPPQTVHCWIGDGEAVLVDVREADELAQARLGEVLVEAERSQTKSPMTIAAIRLLIFTGARKSEILSMRWRDVDVESGIARLPDSNDRRQKYFPLRPPCRCSLVSSVATATDTF